MTTNTAPTFMLTIPLTSGFGDTNYIYQVAAQADGKMLIGGFSGYEASNGFDLIRYNSDGSIDTSYGTQGVTNIEPGNLAGPFPFVLQADGAAIEQGNDYLKRYDSNGHLDSTFGNQGKVSIAGLGANAYYSGSATLQSDGKILIYGYTNNTYGLLRYNSDGSVDTSFSGDGKVGVGSLGTVNSIIEQSDGKILLAGGVGLERYNSDGSLDSSFGNQGLANVHQVLSHAVLQADGKVVAENYYTHDVFRYNSNGSLDTAFGTNGKIHLSDYVDKIMLQADGKLLLKEANALVRYNSDGSIDSSFGNQGTLNTGFANSDDILQADGKIIAVGTGIDYSGGKSSVFYLTRYNSDGTPDTSFTQTVNTVGSHLTITEISHWTANSPGAPIATHAHIGDADLDALNGGLGNYSGASLTLARHGGANADDVFGTRYGLSLANGTVTLNNAAIGTYQQSGGQLTITFGTATSAQVNAVLDQLTYANTSPTAPASLQLDWTFNDGNATNPLSATASTDISIYPRDNGHSGYVMISGTRTAGQTLTASNNLTDPDNGMGAVTYQWLGSSDNFKTSSSLGSGPSLVLTQAMLGAQLKLVASYTDGQGFATSLEAIQGTAGADSFRLDGKSSYVSGLDGNDYFRLDGYGYGGPDIVDGGNGTDLADYSPLTQAVTVNLGLATPQNTFGTQMETLLNIENVFGSSLAANTLTGNAGNNMLLGGYANDTLSGGDGNDNLTGGEGNDVLDGGAGVDTAYYFSATGVTVNLAVTTAQNVLGGAGIDTLLNIENLSGSSYNDTLTGNAGDNALYGLNGNDTLAGGAGNDTLDGGAGNDTLNGGAGTDTASYASATAGVLINLALTAAQNTHNAGTDTLLNIESLRGSAYSDTLLGNTGANTLFGGAGNDLLAGGLGNDTLTGGAGQDTFAFNSTLGTGNIDTLTDFNVADDTIRLAKGTFTTLTTPGVLAAEAFKILGNGGVEDSTDHLLYNTATGALSYDADGSGAGAAVQIAILGTGLAMTNADFMVA